MEFKYFFNPKNRKHLEAYIHMRDYDEWPKDFIPEDVIIGPEVDLDIQATEKLAEEFLLLFFDVIQHDKDMLYKLGFIRGQKGLNMDSEIKTREQFVLALQIIKQKSSEMRDSLSNEFIKDDIKNRISYTNAIDKQLDKIEESIRLIEQTLSYEERK